MVTDSPLNMANLVSIDGSLGEGGGQVLRTALALSIITNRPFEITNIRARRSKPGLMAQHLAAVDAAAAISKAKVDGASLGSSSLTFSPSGIRSGRYKFKISTAGSTSLVVQTIFVPLSLANSASTMIISGGTHVPWSPNFHYLERHWLTYMHQAGFNAQLSLDQAGYFPAGRGRVTATIRPVGRIMPLQLIERGKLKSITGISAVANLDLSIAERQKKQALRRLQNFNWEGRTPDIQIKIIELPSPDKGTLLLLKAQFDGGSCCYNALGAPGKPAERVADDAVDALAAFLETDGVIDQYLADQLLLPLCLSKGESCLRTSKITQHLVTNVAVIDHFLPNRIEILGQLDQPGLVIVGSE
jgi:RNA 3'-terminal phosphate cyclase (ATP)